MNEAQIERIILEARAAGDKYVGRFARHTAERVSKLDHCTCTAEIYSAVCRVLARIDKDKSLMDCVKMQESK